MSALVVAGMHRSGTSLVASLLHRGGCDMGEDLLAGDSNNLPGYFEDLAFLDLNRRMLAATVSPEHPGHPDWGWTEGADPSGIDPRGLDAFVADANALVAYREAQPSAHWGFKDPRTTVLLDFWEGRLTDARYVFVYRAPWDVADSMQRIGAAEFLSHPEFAFSIWRHYNRALLRFAQRHRDRTLIVSAAAVKRDPQALLGLIESRFGMTLDREGLADVAEPSLMTRARPGHAALAAAAHPDCTDLLRELEAAADLPSGDALTAPVAAPPPAGRPQVSIVIPCFNDGEHLLEAIASVEAAVSVPYELIVVDDGSEHEQTRAVLARLRRAGYRIVEQENRGLAEARNRGIRESTAGVYVPLDADNRLRAGFVEAALEVLGRDPDVMAVYGDRREFGLRSGRVLVGVPDLNRLLCGNYIDACAVIRRDAWLACGGYDADMPVAGMEDWDLWLSLLERGFTLQRLDMEAFDYRVRPDSMLSKTLSAQAQASTESYVLAKHAQLYLEHLRRQVDRLDSMALTLAQLEAQVTALP
jgi:hypothetical protein